MASSDVQNHHKSFYLEPIWSNYCVLSIYSTKWGYYPTPPFWPLTCYLKHVNDTNSENMTVFHTRCGDVTMQPIKVPDTHAVAQSRGCLIDMYEQKHPACHPAGLNEGWV